MFVVDFGVGAGAPMQIPNSGKIWKVTHFANAHKSEDRPAP
jgi:hypothetical protein